MYGPIERATAGSKSDALFTKMTVGQVVDTNDPQQMGRLRVCCPALGDTLQKRIVDFPWATYVSPLAGASTSGPRGPGQEGTAGPVGYGMWNIPKAGAQVLVACIDGDPNLRVWLGCVNGQWLTHTLPHGRYSYTGEGDPEGPLSSSEGKIQPLYDNQTEAFAGPNATPRTSFEYRSRAADQQVAAIVEDSTINQVVSEKLDDLDTKFTEEDGNVITSTQGYKRSRIEPDAPAPLTGGVNYDPQTYSWTSPGFHAIAMDDNADNCRIRIRTTGGNQIILDDTNERIYVSTAEGKTWIELDQKGNIDIYGAQEISVSAEKDINFYTKETFRVQAEKGIHLISEEEIRIHAKSGDGLHIKSGVEMFIESVSDMNIKTSTELFVQSGADTNINTGGVAKWLAGSTMNLKSGGNHLVTAPQIHHNGPQAAPAAASTPAFEAFVNSRRPDHEPWGRTHGDGGTGDQDTGNVFDIKLSYNDVNVGRQDRTGGDLGRNPKWHR